VDLADVSAWLTSKQSKSYEEYVHLVPSVDVTLRSAVIRFVGNQIRRIAPKPESRCGLYWWSQAGRMVQAGMASSNYSPEFIVEKVLRLAYLVYNQNNLCCNAAAEQPWRCDIVRHVLTRYVTKWSSNMWRLELMNTWNDARVSMVITYAWGRPLSSI